MMRAAAPALAAALLVLAGGASASEAQTRDLASPGRAAVPAAMFPELRGDGGRLRALDNVYDVVVIGDSSTMLVGRHRVEVQESSFAGSPAWMVVDHREAFEPFVRITAADTVLLGPEALAPRRWDAHTGDARFVAAFTNDSVYGGATSPLARRTFTLGAAGALLTSEGALDALLQTVALHAGWSAQATMLVADLGGGRLVPVTLRVAYEWRLQIPAGTFDAWVVHVAGGGTHRWIWMDKATGVVLRAETLSPHMPGMLVERTLSHATLP